MPRAAPDPYCRVTRTAGGLEISGQATAAFGYAVALDHPNAPSGVADPTRDFGRDDAYTGENEALADYLVGAPGATALGSSLAGLSGVFGGWIFDGGVLQVFSDHLGQRPIYVRLGGDYVGVAPRLSPLLKLPGAPPAIDTRQRDFFRHHGYYGGSGTAYEGIYRIWGGQVYTVSEGLRISERAYATWDFVGQDAPLLPHDLADRTWAYLRGATRRYRAHASRLMVPLSGGLDSRTLLAAAVEAARDDGRGLGAVRTSTFGDADSSDVRVATRVAQVLEVPHARYTYDYSAWLMEAHANVTEAEGQLSAAHLVPPRRAMAAYDEDMCLLSGVAGNWTLGGEAEGYHLVASPTPSALAAYDFPPPATLLTLANGAYRHELLAQVTRTRRMISAACLGARHGRYRMPLVEWGLLRLLYGQSHRLRTGRRFQRALGCRHFGDALLEVPLAQDGRRLNQRRYTPTRALESLRYRAYRALGHELNPSFLSFDEVWRRHGPAIRTEVTRWAADVSLPHPPGDDTPIHEWLHLLTLAFHATS